jgi:3-methylcrotonyl-CoA carboxylase alpha subunit
MHGRFEVRVGDHVVPAAATGDSTVDVEGRTITVTPVEPGVVRLTVDGSATLAYVASGGDRRWVHLRGRVYVVEVAQPGGPRRRRDDGGGLVAPMPATVRSVLISPGDTVRNGETLLVLEAMKMELPIRATHDGTISAVHCTVGELVPGGFRLIEMS